VRLGSEPIDNRLSETRLADTWLPRDQDDAAVAHLCLLPAPHQQRYLLVTADEGRCGRAQRLEPALNRACPQRSPCMYRLRDTFNFLDPKVLKLEQIAEKSSCVCTYYDRVWLGYSLQARCEIRCLADDASLLRLA
jgi:hypothetical protein